MLVVTASLFSIRYLDRLPSERLAALLGITVTVRDINQTPIPSPQVFPAQGNESAILGLVTVQTYSGATLIRQGTGTAVSVDGLVLTLASIAPYGSGSYVYQVATPHGQVARAYRVASDRQAGLVLLKADIGDLDAVLFDDGARGLNSGQGLESVSSRIAVSQFEIMRLPVWVVSIMRDHEITLSLDRAYGPLFHGARLIDASQRSVGIIRYGTQPVLISAASLNSFIESYLAGVK